MSCRNNVSDEDYQLTQSTNRLLCTCADLELMNKVVEGCISRASEFSPGELARLLRWTGKMQLRDSSFLSAITDAVVEKQQDMSLPQLCWAVWGLAKVNHQYPLDSFAEIADRVSAKLRVGASATVYICDVCRSILS